MGGERDALQERYDFVLAACREAQDLASRYGWALREIADMDPHGQRADDLGRAARVARSALLGKANSALPACDDCEHPTLCTDFPCQHCAAGTDGGTGNG